MVRRRENFGVGKVVKMCKRRAPPMVLQGSIYRQNVEIKLIKVNE